MEKPWSCGNAGAVAASLVLSLSKARGQVSIQWHTVAPDDDGDKQDVRLFKGPAGKRC